MKETILYTILLLSVLSCSTSNKSDQKILIEEPSNLIVNKSDKSPYSGEITITGEENIRFQGEALNGRKHGKCCWIKENGDTIQLQIYDRGDMIYSNQFDFNGNRSTEWIKYTPEITFADSTLIDRVFKIIESSNYDVLENMLQQHQLPYSKLTKDKISNFETEFGNLEKITLKKIDKSSYNFRPEKYLELETISKFESKSLEIGIRLLEDKGMLQTIEIWEIKTKRDEVKSYEDFSLWTYLNI
jgi:hypothetical protein